MDNQPGSFRQLWLNRAERRAPPRPAGPRGLPVLGSLPEMWGNPLQYLLAASLRYGDVFQFRLGTRPFLFVSHPDGIKHMLQDHVRNYVRWPREDKNYRALLGHGLLTSDGDTWRRHHNLAQPAFNRRRLAALAGTIADTVAEVSLRWDRYALSGQAIDVAAEMGRLTLAIVLRALFGFDASDQVELIGHSLSSAIRHVVRGLMLPFELPALANRRFLATVRGLDAMVEQVIQNRQRDPQAGDNLLGLLMAAPDDGGAGLSGPELRDEVMTFLLAGHETSALGLSWLWYLLAEHPEAERRVRAEAAGTLGGRAPAEADLANLPYLMKVIHEGLRLYPPSGSMVRYALSRDEIGGQPVAAGSVVILSPYVTHRLPAFWPNPEVFDPERFADGRAAERPRYAYFPFAGGPHQCMGINFALMEVPFALAMLTQRYRLEPWPGQTIDPRPAMDMYPRRPMMMRVVARGED